MRARRIAIFSGVALAMVLVAAIAVSTRGSGGTPVDPMRLRGTTWNVAEGTMEGSRVLSVDRLTADTMQEEGLIAIEPLAVRLRFDASSVEGVVGCRDFEVPFTVDGTSIQWGEPVIDDAICEANPDWGPPTFYDTITSATTLTMDGDLIRFSGAGDEISFEEVPTTEAALRVDL